MGPRLGIGPDRIDVIPRGRDEAPLGDPGAIGDGGCAAALGVAEASLLVVAAARHEYQKGLDVLDRRLASIREADARRRAAHRRAPGNETARLEAAVQEQGPGSGIALLGAA